MLNNITTNAWGNKFLCSIFRTGSPVNVQVSKQMSEYIMEQHETLRNQAGDSGRYSKPS